MFVPIVVYHCAGRSVLECARVARDTDCGLFSGCCSRVAALLVSMHHRQQTFVAVLSVFWWTLPLISEFSPSCYVVKRSVEP